MAAFELNSRENNERHEHHDRHEHHEHSRVHENNDCKPCHDLSPNRLREECIIALKVYDSCRQQDCLTNAQVGPARSAECIRIGDEQINEGAVITPPSNAAAVTIDKLKIKKIIIVDKQPNSFRNGFWDIDLKYVFEYRLTFREADGCPIGSIRANSIFNRKVTLFGSIGSDLVISTDLFAGNHSSNTLDADPFILVEAKGVALNAEIKYVSRRVSHCDDDVSPEPSSVNVTIGLFAIVKLFRIVNLTVESRGFCIAEEGGCEETDPCDFFDSLSFPMDVFAPPQKPEFFAGISNNIPRQKHHDNHGHHGHHGHGHHEHHEHK
jgi:hypothetical protein